MFRYNCLAQIDLCFGHDAKILWENPEAKILTMKKLFILTNDQSVGFLRKFVWWNFQVKRSWSFTNTARDIIMRTMAWAEPTTKFTSYG
jgi:hypothetical protein